MSKTSTKFSLILFLLLVQFTLAAQINSSSPYPVDFQLLEPESIAGSYPYGTQSGWGPTLAQTVQGDVVWAYNAAGDSLGCEAITTDLTGKIALIRRGVCNFTVKVFNAQEAGAVGVIVVNHFTDPMQTDSTVMGMGGDDDNVTIPAVFVSRRTGELIDEALQQGQTVVASFIVSNYVQPVGYYSYETPLSEVQPFDLFSVFYHNPSSTETAEAVLGAVITDPSGATTDLTPQMVTVAPLDDSLVIFPDAYTPTMKGEYTVTYFSDAVEEVATARFRIGDFTFATDNFNVINAFGPTATGFAQANLKYQAGALVLTGADGAVATHATFGLAGTDDVVVGNATADAVTVILYDADANDDQTLDFGSPRSFDDLTPVAFGTYVMSGTEEFEELITVELESLEGDAVMLKPNGAYYISILYDGTAAGTGNAPLFSVSEEVDYTPLLPTTPIELDQFYPGGWAGATTIVRLHLDGFATDVREVLAPHKVTVLPNPVSDLVSLQLQLERSADVVRVGLLDFNGRLILARELRGAQNETLEFDVSRLPAGTYFFSIVTPEGFRSEKFVVVK